VSGDSLTDVRGKENAMTDDAIHSRIEQLVTEEHELWKREAQGEATEDDRRRLEDIKVSLDQSWDFLRQRQALRDAGLDPEVARARSAEVVENYEQ
jgi:hypothetical protein